MPDPRSDANGEEARIPGSLFGYDTLVQRPEYVGLTGEGVRPLKKGMHVTLAGDSRG